MNASHKIDSIFSRAARRCALVVAIVLVSLNPIAGEASTETPHHVNFDIPAQSMATALLRFSEQTGIQVTSQAETLQILSTAGVRGDYPAAQALEILLEGSGLIYKFVDKETVVVRQRSGAATAQAEQTAYGNKDMRLVSVDSEKKEAATDSGPVAITESSDDRTHEVIVTGSRISRASIEGPQEVRSYSKEQIEQSGQGTVADFLSNLPEVSVASVDGPVRYANQTTVQLHGLPTGTTLVLLNGHRLPINNYGFFDLNNIPLAAVQRVEVLPVGASAIYGADSLAGAINIILRSDAQGGEFNVKLGHADGSDEASANLGFGQHWNRGGILVLGSYHHKGDLLASERAVSADAVYSSLPSFGIDDRCAPGTVYAIGAGNLPGLTSNRAAIPNGISGTPAIGDFAATAGRRNVCNFLKYSAALSGFDRYGLLLTGQLRIGAAAEVFTETLVSRAETSSRTGNLLGFNSTLGASNPFNPFGTAVRVTYSYADFPSSYERETDFVRPLLGVKGQLFDDWSYEISASMSDDESDVHQRDPNPTAINAALISANPATALNPFSSGAPGAAQLLESLVLAQTITVKSKSSASQALVRGPLFSLPPGAVEFVFGAEWEKSEISTSTSVGAVSAAAVRNQRIARSIFTEARIPILANTESAGRGEKIALSLAGRLDDTDDYGRESTGQAGIEWRPTQSLLLRGGYATSYRAPQLTQLAGAISSITLGGLFDPFRGNQALGQIPVQRGPNPNLNPETGVSRQIGVVYASQQWPGFEASLTHWRIDIENFINTAVVQDLVSFPQYFPGVVTRAPQTPADIQNGFLGAIVNINNTFTNYGDFKVAGFDLDMRHRLSTGFGEMTPSISVTRTSKYTSAISPSAPIANRLNQATLTGYAPRWKGAVGLGWKSGELSAHLNGQYVGRYNDYPGSLFPYPHDIGNFWLCDASFRYEIGTALSGRVHWLAGSHVTVGAVNLLDTLPKAAYQTAGYDQQQGDIRGRLLYAQFGMKW